MPKSKVGEIFGRNSKSSKNAKTDRVALCFPPTGWRGGTFVNSPRWQCFQDQWSQCSKMFEWRQHRCIGPKLRSLQLTPTPEVRACPGPGNPELLAKTKTFVFWHIVEISARYYRQIDRTDVAHLFWFQEIMNNLPRGPKKRPMTPKYVCLGVQKRGPWLQKYAMPYFGMACHILAHDSKKFFLGVQKRGPWLQKKLA